MKNIFTFFTLILLLCTAVSGPAQKRTAYTAKQPVQWFREGVIYQVWLRSFTREGTLKAAEKRLPEIADLGATIVYLPPIMLADTLKDRQFWSPRQNASPGGEARNPYKTMDYATIDPEYGTEQDLKRFIATAHKLGLRVIMDMVYLHTGPSSNLTRDPKNYHSDSNGGILKNQWNFLRLNFNHRPLREYLIKDMEHWVRDVGADGFRCDVSGGVPVDFWEEARACLEKIKPDVGMLAESDSPEELLRAFDASYGFPWMEELKNVVVKGAPAQQLRETWVKQNLRFPKGTLFARYSDNHDQNRSDLVFGETGSRAVNVLNFMLDGIPFLYNGQEIGDGAPFGIFEHWSILWESQGLPQKTELRNWYKDLIRLRKSTPVLHSGETVWLETSRPESVVAFLRAGEAGEVLTVVNISNRQLDVQIRLPEEKNAIYKSLMRGFDSRTNYNAEVQTPLPQRPPEVSVNGRMDISLEALGYFAGSPD